MPMYSMPSGPNARSPPLWLAYGWSITMIVRSDAKSNAPASSTANSATLVAPAGSVKLTYARSPEGANASPSNPCSPPNVIRSETLSTVVTVSPATCSMLPPCSTKYSAGSPSRHARSTGPSIAGSAVKETAGGAPGGVDAPATFADAALSVMNAAAAAAARMERVMGTPREVGGCGVSRSGSGLLGRR